MRSAASPNKRCSWVNVDDPLLLEYHDREWGVPVHSDHKHFEVLVLSGAQAGLKWSLVLKKREGYRRAFDSFDPERVARYSEKQIRRLLADPQIIRNRMKIEAAVRNARAFLEIQEEFGSFDSYCWRFDEVVAAIKKSVGNPNIAEFWKSMQEAKSASELDAAIQRVLGKTGLMLFVEFDHGMIVRKGTERHTS